MFHPSPAPGSRASVRRRALARLALAALVASALALPAAGCRGGSRGGAPGPSASPAEVASYLEGGWTASVQTSLTQERLQQLNIPLTLEARAGQLSGRVMDVPFEGGTVATAGELPAVRFTTGDVVVPGATGETTVRGPLQWQATLRNGRLEGQVTGPDGQGTSWFATKNR